MWRQSISTCSCHVDLLNGTCVRAVIKEHAIRACIQDNALCHVLIALARYDGRSDQRDAHSCMRHVCTWQRKNNVSVSAGSVRSGVLCALLYIAVLPKPWVCMRNQCGVVGAPTDKRTAPAACQISATAAGVRHRRRLLDAQNTTPRPPSARADARYTFSSLQVRPPAGGRPRLRFRDGWWASLGTRETLRARKKGAAALSACRWRPPPDALTPASPSTTPTATPWSRSGHVDKHMKVLVLRGAPARTARSFALTTTAQHARLRIPFSMCVLPDMLTRALHRWRAGARSVSHSGAADASASDTVRARTADLLLRQLRSRSTALEWPSWPCQRMSGE